MAASSSCQGRHRCTPSAWPDVNPSGPFGGGNPSERTTQGCRRGRPPTPLRWCPQAGACRPVWHPPRATPGERGNEARVEHPIAEPTPPVNDCRRSDVGLRAGRGRCPSILGVGGPSMCCVLLAEQHRKRRRLAAEQVGGRVVEPPVGRREPTQSARTHAHVGACLLGIRLGAGWPFHQWRTRRARSVFHRLGWPTCSISNQVRPG